MSTAQHAGRILEAWRRADPATFEIELEDALAACRTARPASALEYEQQELLESIAEHLRTRGASHRVDTGLALLRHLEVRIAA